MFLFLKVTKIFQRESEPKDSKNSSLDTEKSEGHGKSALKQTHKLLDSMIVVSSFLFVFDDSFYF